MTTQTAPRRGPALPQPTTPDPGTDRTPPLSWRSLGTDLSYLSAGFFLALFSFVLLLPLVVVGASTVILWIGMPILGFTLLVATWFARENREALRRWGLQVPEPVYRTAGRRRLHSMLLDAQAWRDLLHGAVIGFSLRLVTFTLPLTWVAGALGGLTWWIWGVFLPRDEYNGLAWLLVNVAGLDLGSNRYLVEAGAMFVSGLALALTAPLVARVCARFDAGVTRVLVGGQVEAVGGWDR